MEYELSGKWKETPVAKTIYKSVIPENSILIHPLDALHRYQQNYEVPATLIKQIESAANKTGSFYHMSGFESGSYARVLLVIPESKMIILLYND